MRISDWSSDVCSSDLALGVDSGHIRPGPAIAEQDLDALRRQIGPLRVADDDVRQYLAAKADPLGRIARGNAAAVELIADELVGDRLARDPHPGDENDHRAGGQPSLLEQQRSIFEPRFRLALRRVSHRSWPMTSWRQNLVLRPKSRSGQKRRTSYFAARN